MTSPPLLVIRREAALAGVVVAARELRAAVERLDRAARQRAEAHRRDVDDRARAPRSSCGRGARRAPSRKGSRGACRATEPGEAHLAEREHRVLDDRIADVVDLIVGSEAEVVVLAFRRSVDPLALFAVEGQLLAVAGDDVLAQLRADLDQQVAEVSDDRKVGQNVVLRKEAVIGRDGRERHPGSPQKPSSRLPNPKKSYSSVYVSEACLKAVRTETARLSGFCYPNFRQCRFALLES